MKYDMNLHPYRNLMLAPPTSFRRVQPCEKMKHDLKCDTFSLYSLMISDYFNLNLNLHQFLRSSGNCTNSAGVHLPSIFWTWDTICTFIWISDSLAIVLMRERKENLQKWFSGCGCGARIRTAILSEPLFSLLNPEIHRVSQISSSCMWWNRPLHGQNVTDNIMAFVGGVANTLDCQTLLRSWPGRLAGME